MFMNEFTSLTSFLAFKLILQFMGDDEIDGQIRTGEYSISRRSLKWGRLIWKLRLHSDSIAFTIADERIRQKPTTILSQDRHCSEDKDGRDRRKKKSCIRRLILPELLPAMSGTWSSCRVPPILNIAFLLHFLFLWYRWQPFKSVIMSCFINYDNQRMLSKAPIHAQECRQWNDPYGDGCPTSM